MCIIFVAIKQHPDYPLIIAANRDEFYNRPTQVSHWWQQSPAILAGKDLKAGGSWMGISREGDIAALTNIRNPLRDIQNARSRGELIPHYLNRTSDDATFAQSLKATSQQYNGYNLLFGHLSSLQVYNNHTDTLTPLHAGFHGLSNHALNTPWPKVTRGVAGLKAYISSNKKISQDALLLLLQDETPAPDNALPDTGVPVDWEKRLSSIFIRSAEYGTRSSTLLLINQDNDATWVEQSYGHSKNGSNKREFKWKIALE